jgi:hypothetical protein
VHRGAAGEVDCLEVVGDPAADRVGGCDAVEGVAIQPPTASGVATPLKAKTQCATGKYTSTAHSPANTIHALNFIRSAAAPETSATVIAANNA